jgi:hypothetical protein
MTLCIETFLSSAAQWRQRPKSSVSTPFVHIWERLAEPTLSDDMARDMAKSLNKNAFSCSSKMQGRTQNCKSGLRNYLVVKTRQYVNLSGI